MVKLSTSDEQTNEDKVMAFIQVLQCSQEEAQFYLESAAWDTETAVILWLDSNSQMYTHDNVLTRMPMQMMQMMPVDRSGFPNMQFLTQNRWKGKVVKIEGLDSDWTARVSRSNGQIYFTNNITGVQIYSVPPGFADLDPEEVTNQPETNTNVNTNDECDSNPEEHEMKLTENNQDNECNSTQSSNSNLANMSADKYI